MFEDYSNFADLIIKNIGMYTIMWTCMKVVYTKSDTIMSNIKQSPTDKNVGDAEKLTSHNH